MKTREKTQEKPKRIKRKLLAALAMLLVSTIMLGSASYAWFVLSVAPEVTGITTSVGSNGSLEIALLTTETWQDLSSIRSNTGSSLANNESTVANITWGNLLDVSDPAYGLGTIMLMPSRLNATQNGDGYVVNNGILSVPTYGYDGRIIELDNNTLSAIYSTADTAFSYASGTQDYGIRAVGTNSELSAQAAALAQAKTSVTTYTKSANNAASAAFDSNGEALIDIVLVKTQDGDFNDTHVDSLEALISGLQTSLDYIDLAIRQGMVAYAAAAIEDADEFTTARDMIVNTAIGLDTLLEQVSGYGASDALASWVEKLATAENNLNVAIGVLAALEGGSYTWEQIQPAMNYVLNTSSVYLNDDLVDNLSSDSIEELLTAPELTLTLAPDSGVPADIADFVDDFNSMLTYLGKTVTITTSTLEDTPYLTLLSEAISGLETSSDVEVGTLLELESTYGYVLDMAFRTNAANSDLLLQTAAQQRIYSDSTSAATQGGGSYMVFNSSDDSFTVEKTVRLMDAIRVAFLDDQGNILAVAKLNTSNRYTDEEGVKAPLYLYEYSFSTAEEDYGAIVMGERRATDSTITSLDQDTAKALSVVVWLDGDVVDNSMVSATESASLTGMLNLQFASSADLVPAGYGDLMNYATDKTELAAVIETETEIYNAGQGIYTTESWENYTDAYEYAVAVNENVDATLIQIYNASRDLSLAKNELDATTPDALLEKIGEIRAIVGQTSTVARVAIWNEETGAYDVIKDYTDEQYTAAGNDGLIFSVDHEDNYRDEGNETLVPIYSDESWMALANALYAAEAVAMNENADYAAIDAAITALDEAYEGLTRAALFVAYEYNNSLYYFVINDETDTYGKWYDSDFNLVVADKTILDLDAHAVPAEIAVIETAGYIRNTAGQRITPYITVMDDIYPDLANDTIKAIHWNTPDMFTVVNGSEDEEETTVPTDTDPDVYDVVYNVNYTGSVLELASSELGSTTISAVVLTENGIVYTATKTVTVYAPADGVQINDGEYTVQAGSTIDLSAALTGDGHTETVQSWTWASSSTDIATVTSGSGTITVTGKEEGSVTVYLTVETVQGNTYTDSITVTVTPGPNAEVEEPTT